MHHDAFVCFGAASFMGPNAQHAPRCSANRTDIPTGCLNTLVTKLMQAGAVPVWPNIHIHLLGRLPSTDPACYLTTGTNTDVLDACCFSGQLCSRSQGFIRSPGPPGPCDCQGAKWLGSPRSSSSRPVSSSAASLCRVCLESNPLTGCVESDVNSGRARRCPALVSASLQEPKGPSSFEMRFWPLGDLTVTNESRSLSGPREAHQVCHTYRRQACPNLEHTFYFHQGQIPCQSEITP